MFDFIFHLTLGDWILLAAMVFVLWKLVRWFVGQSLSRYDAMDAVKFAAAAARETLRNEFGYRVLASCKGDPAKIAAAIKKNPWLARLVGGDHGA